MAKYYFKATKKIYEIDANRTIWKNYIIKEIMNMKRSVIYLDPNGVNTLMSTRHPSSSRDKVRISMTSLGYGKWINQQSETINSDVEVIDHDNGIDITVEDGTLDNQQSETINSDVEVIDDLRDRFVALKEDGKTYQEILKELGINPKKYAELNQK